MSLEPDHLVVCVVDLEAAGREFVNLHGLASVEGGRHPGHGTANRIVPLGDSYIELVAVVDDHEAAGSPFGLWVSSQASGQIRVDALCLRTSDIESVARERGLESVSMSRARPDGSTLSWTVAGIERTIADGYPFFIEWGVPDSEMPGRTSLGQAPSAAHLDSVEIAGDSEALQTWIYGASRVKVASGSPTTNALITTATGAIRI